jgi:phenylpropionate dioxygenase-like ring-hydroxylating dioxygenase large terminal subunit
VYPLPNGMFAPRNHWYVAAWSDQVTREPLERWILGDLVVLYRRADGGAVALQGRCPHRHFPLGKSRVVGDNIQCRYHGMTFAPDGGCVLIPSQDAIPAASRIRSYPVVERWEWIWIWTGDPELCDESLIPDHDALGLMEPNNNILPLAHHYLEGRHMLVHDNLLDLTHLAYLHEGSLGSPEAATVEESRSETERSVGSHRVIRNVPPVQHFAKILQYDGMVDRYYGGDFLAPSLYAFYDDFYPAGGDTPLMKGRVFHAITPGTEHTTHYFFASGRDKPSDLPKEHHVAAANRVLTEDALAIEEIEKMLQVYPEVKDVLLRADATCMRGRRLMQRLIEAERRQGAAA